jgi:WD40 repeat protein
MIAVGSGAYPLVGDPTTMLIGNRLLRVWDIENNKLVHNLEGHMSAILGIDMDDTHIVSSSRDALVKLWDLKTGECSLLYGHDKCVYNVMMEKNIIISSSKDTTVKIWNRTDLNCIHTITDHDKEVRCLGRSENYIATGCDDEKIRIYDMTTLTLLQTIDSEKYISCLSCNGHDIVVNIAKGLNHYDMRTGKFIRTFKKKSNDSKFSQIREIKFDENKLLVGDRKGK